MRIFMEKVMSSASSTVDYRHYIYAGSSRTPVAVYSRTGTANSQNKVRYLLDDPQDSVGCAKRTKPTLRGSV